MQTFLRFANKKNLGLPHVRNVTSLSFFPGSPLARPGLAVLVVANSRNSHRPHEIDADPGLRHRQECCTGWGMGCACRPGHAVQA